MPPRFTTEEITVLLEELRQFSTTHGQDGVTRLAFSREDEAAHRYLADKLATQGLSVCRDAMGTIFARLPGYDRSLPAIATGSHIDSVPNGGAYDGTLGVITGLYALAQCEPGELKRDVELVVFRAEESSRFGFSCIGSKVLTGHIDRSAWTKNTDDQGLTVFQALSAAGYAENDLASCELAPARYDAFIELHIEQGRRLENEGKTLGIVEGIAAPTRFRVTVTGLADHSGATPMYQRHDALVASAMIIEDVHHAACKEMVYGTVGTVGKLDVSPNAMNVIPGLVKFYVDIRGIDKNSIQRVADRLADSVNKVAKENDVQIALESLAAETPTLLNKSICRLLEENAVQEGITCMRMASGAGHDAMYMASRYPTAMLFVPSREGISHHPAEYTAPQDIALAAKVLKNTLARLANA